MKRRNSSFLLAVFLSLFIREANSQSIKNYDKEWKKVEDILKQQLPKSALVEVKKIYALAKKENQDAQVIKSLVYITQLQQENREDNEILSIKEVEKEINGSKEPAASILNSLLAELYWNYYQQHRWEFYDRTKTKDFIKEDIATWGAEDFHKKISELFLKSVSKETLLQQTKLQPFDAILVKGNVRHLRPTLFDLLAFKALAYFENDERDINKPAYSFEIDQAAAFDPAADFVHFKFTTKDSLSLSYKALLLYQQLIAFHLHDAKPDALIDADIQRIQFVKNKSVHPAKDQLYFNAINHIARQYENLPAASQAWYLLALYYEEKANTYDPFRDTTHRYDHVKAKEIVTRIMQQKDSSEGKINATNLLLTINAKDLVFELEKVNVPDRPFRVLVNYRNVNTLYFRLVKPDENLKTQLEERYTNKYWQAITSARALKNWQQVLPVTTDLQTHHAEVKVDALAAGEYLLVASTDKDFTSKNAILGARLFYVSNISYVGSDRNYFVLDRDNGQPLAKASVQVWEQKYDYTTSKYTREKGKLYQADANGFFRMDRRKEDPAANKRYTNYAYNLEITHGSDHLFMNDWTQDYYYSTAPADAKTDPVSIFLFTDRSLYRPGQTVFFKGITITKKEKAKGNVLPDFETMILLRDANGTAIDSMKVKTNEFGSFSGKFALPQTALNGDFSLITTNSRGYTQFKMEEYKRPKFYVEYESIKGVYKINDRIKVTGIAKAYAGNTIDGATVKYRVVREARFLYPWMSWRWWPRSSPQEIAHGETKTDKDGKFTVEFTAIPDLALDKKSDPVFHYTVYADATDINGETRSGEKSVDVSYKALKLNVAVPARLPVDSLKSLSIRTENMNNEFEPATVKVIIYKLKEEKRLIRKRYWQRPDQFVMSKEEYIRNFPYDEYDNETDPLTWEKEEKVFEKTDSARVNGQWAINNGQWKPGFYVVEVFTKDKNGEEVKDIRQIELYDEKSNRLNEPAYLWFDNKQSGKEPGDKAKIELGTAADNLFVIQQVNKDSTLGMASSPRFSYLRLDNEKKTIEFPIQENDRGGYGVGWLFVKHNRFYQQSTTIDVPWTNKNLQIEYATYRDKTLPGSEEKWKLKISGYKNEKVAAEMLASMYDASLDQFYGHAWMYPDVWPTYYQPPYTQWNVIENFASVQAEKKYMETTEQKYVNKQYDQLISFYNVRQPLAYEMMRTTKAASPVPPGDFRVQAGMGYDQIQVGNFKKEEELNLLDREADGKADQMDNRQVLPPPSGEIQVRKNFNETAFFFPDLRTDSSGAIEFSFTIPEALTKWKFQALAHTKNLSFGYSTKEIITQKQLMVQPNAPRFLREGDKMEFSSKIVNLTEKEMTGQAELQLIDATTNQPVDGWFKNITPHQYFTVPAGQSGAVKFSIEIPYQFNKALVWRIIARAGDFSDGEEMAMPVLTNRILVTETLALPMKGTGTKKFTFDKLLQSGKSETIQHYAMTVEYTSNPAWYAVQALPYLMEYPYDCAEQTWNRYYANSLAAFIANSAPRIRQVFDQWKTKDTAALLSNLQKNEELKGILLEETPWVLQAKTEAEQKKNIALLFDMLRMSKEMNSAFEKLKQMQSSNGGFVWFKGGPDDRFITQYIVTGIGHLKKLNGIGAGQDANLKQLLATAIPYLDKKMKADYDNLVKNKTDLKKYVPDYSQIQYLYMRSFFPEYKIAAAAQTAYTYFRNRAPLAWTQQNKYMQGMLALALARTGDTKTPAAILKSLKETALVDEELGMYWKDARRSWWWYEAPVERQALLIEAFQEIGKDTKTVDDLRTWLLKNKQTNNWESTKATAEACYALLLQGTQWLTSEPAVEIDLGSTIINTTGQEEAGTGYLKKTIDGRLVTPAMGNISVTVKAPAGNATGSTWGSVYWQYFENLDKITTAATPLSLVKKLFIEKNTDRGPVLTPVKDGDFLKVGDKIKVRIELRVDRDMEYVHMKDMRASCMEPVNVLSGYKWQGGLGYYETTKDASTSFFFGNLYKGTYVFEYPLFVTHTGNFSNGITTIQSMYAPEFSSHSEGIRVNVE